MTLNADVTERGQGVDVTDRGQSAVTWLACSCYAWPIILGQRVGTCGYCGERPSLPIREPASGKAGPRK